MGWHKESLGSYSSKFRVYAGYFKQCFSNLSTYPNHLGMYYILHLPGLSTKVSGSEEGKKKKNPGWSKEFRINTPIVIKPAGDSLIRATCISTPWFRHTERVPMTEAEQRENIYNTQPQNRNSWWAPQGNIHCMMKNACFIIQLLLS